MILKSVQIVYDFVSAIKNKLYDLEFIQKVSLDIPVISVGNLSVGGTGKTPCVYLIATEMLKINKYKKIVIISRSYRGRLKRPERVNLNSPDTAQLYGDEPCLLQMKLPDCAVWAGPVKNKTAQAACLVEKPDLLIVDDGFSHRKLGRQLDLVLIDATDPLNYFQTLPVGRLREPLDQLKRAQLVLLTKTNLVHQDEVKNISDLIFKGRPYLQSSVYRAESKLKIKQLDPKYDQLYVFCGLGNPDSLKNAVEQLGFKIVNLKKFPDHYHFSDLDLDTVYDEFLILKKQNPNLKLITTAKDLVRIKHHKILQQIVVIDYDIEIENLKKVEFFEKICSFL